MTEKTTTAEASTRAFGQMMTASMAEGLIDERTKELIQLALIIVTKCEPCIDAHWEKAITMGISPEEIEEVSWMAASMGGAPVRMFFQKWKEKSGK